MGKRVILSVLVKSYFYFDKSKGPHELIYSCEADDILEADKLLLQAKGIVAAMANHISCKPILPNPETDNS